MKLRTIARLSGTDLLRLASILTGSTSVREEGRHKVSFHGHDAYIDFDGLCYSSAMFSDRADEPFTIRIYEGDKMTSEFKRGVDGKFLYHGSMFDAKRTRERIEQYLMGIGFESRHEMVAFMKERA